MGELFLKLKQCWKMIGIRLALDTLQFLRWLHKKQQYELIDEGIFELVKICIFHPCLVLSLM